MAVHELKLPTWYRVLAIVVGVMSIVLALIVLVFPVLAVWLLIYILAFALLMIGIDRLVRGDNGSPVGPMMVTAGMVGALGRQQVNGLVLPARVRLRSPTARPVHCR